MKSEHIKAKLDRTERKEAKATERALNAFAVPGSAVDSSAATQTQGLQAAMVLGGCSSQEQRCPAALRKSSAFQEATAADHRNSSVVQEAIDLAKKKADGTLSSAEAKSMACVEEYYPIMDFTMRKLPAPESVGDVLAQVRKVLPVLDKKANLFKTGGVQTGICGGLDERLPVKVKNLRKRVLALERLNPRQRADHSLEDLLMIQKDLQKQVGLILVEITTSSQEVQVAKTQVELQSDRSWELSISRATVSTCLCCCSSVSVLWHKDFAPCKFSPRV